MATLPSRAARDQPGSWVPKAPTLSLSLFLSVGQFSQQEEKRQKSERLQQQQKHENQMRDMMAQCDSNMSELQQLQVSSRPAPPHPCVALACPSRWCLRGSGSTSRDVPRSTGQVMLGRAHHPAKLCSTQAWDGLGVGWTPIARFKRGFVQAVMALQRPLPGPGRWDKLLVLPVLAVS